MIFIPTHYSVLEHVRKLEVQASHEEQLYHILDIYLKLFPARNAFLFRYSPLGYLGEGIIQLTSTQLIHIRERSGTIFVLYPLSTQPLKNVRQNIVPVLNI